MALLSMAVVLSKVVVKFLTQCVLLLPMCVRARARVRACVRAIVCVCVWGGWVGGCRTARPKTNSAKDNSVQGPKIRPRQLGPMQNSKDDNSAHIFLRD